MYSCGFQGRISIGIAEIQSKGRQWVNFSPKGRDPVPIASPAHDSAPLIQDPL